MSERQPPVSDAAKARQLMELAESHSWYESDGELPRVRAIIAAAQVYATLASRVTPPAKGGAA